jgi:1,4-dihydroxy-2-naphthoate octaprenyltransferase
MKRSIFSRFLFLGLFMMTGVIYINAQQYTIQGTVVDTEDGEAVEFATVQLLAGSANTFV